MKRKITRGLQRLTLPPVGAGVGERASAYSPFGPVRAGLTTTQRTKEDQVLLELHNSLESKMLELNIKSYAVLNTLIDDTILRARRGVSFSNTTTTK